MAAPLPAMPGQSHRALCSVNETPSEGETVLDRLFRRQREARAAAEFFGRIVAQARRPEFYRDLGVPDSLDGRFDMVALHVFLVMHRLKGQGEAAESWSRRLYEVMLDDFEKSLMELGAGDSGIPRRMKQIARGMAGRIDAYHKALEGGSTDSRVLEVALDNNLYGTVPDTKPAWLAAMAGYVRATVSALAGQPLEGLLAGEIRFADPPAAGPAPG